MEQHMALVDIALARQHCKAEAEDDPILQVYLGAAEQHALDFLNRQVFATQTALDAAVSGKTALPGAMVLNGAIQSAILLLCGHLYANREDSVVGVSVSQVPTGALELLRPHRRFPGIPE